MDEFVVSVCAESYISCLLGRFWLALIVTWLVLLGKT